MTSVESAPSRHVRVVSPELALVDPELALWLKTQPETSVEPAPAPVLRIVPGAEWDSYRSPLDRVRAALLGVRITRSRALAAVVFLAVLIGVGPRITLHSTTEAPLPSVAQHVDASVTTSQRPESKASEPKPGALVPRSKQPRSTVPSSNVPRRFAWPAVATARAYDFEIFRAAKRVYSARVSSPRLVVPPRWTFNGSMHSLVAGEYRWYVWPVIAGRRATSAIVQARLDVD